MQISETKKHCYYQNETVTCAEFGDRSRFGIIFVDLRTFRNSAVRRISETYKFLKVNARRKPHWKSFNFEKSDSTKTKGSLLKKLLIGWTVLFFNSFLVSSAPRREPNFFFCPLGIFFCQVAVAGPKSRSGTLLIEPKNL